MSRFLIVKVTRSLITLWIVATFAFVALNFSGDPIDALVGDHATAETIQRYREKFGLDRPLWVQYVSYFANIAQGEFGVSLSSQRPAIELVAEALPYTLELGALALGGGLVVGALFGIAAAMYRNSVFDRIIMGIAVFGFSLPNFFLGILLILLFALKWRILPSSGTGSFLNVILPALTLGLHFAGTFARFTRSSMLEIFHKQYISSARARGIPRSVRIFRHALPNAAIPIVTIIGIKFNDLVAGSIIVETVFAWPGVGRLLIVAITTRDFALVQAILIVVSVTTVLANLTVDIIYTLIDPRMRAAKAGE